MSRIDKIRLDDLISCFSKRTWFPVITLPERQNGESVADYARRLNRFVRDNSDRYKNIQVILFHGTGRNVSVKSQGLLPTSVERRRSYQSSSGYVYLSADPWVAERFGSLGNSNRHCVYAVLVNLRDLKPDLDQLHNKRSVGVNVGNTLGESLAYTSCARVKGRIEPWRVIEVMPEPELEPDEGMSMCP
ncbi:MAG: hypothetical protein D6732_07515 [Methanobacteriota archaeon]|nr:MAG: hypothetical protein D6732_07515 [Euryarchaeota archaeon]